MIYYSIWPNQGTQCLSVCTPDPQKVIQVLKPKISLFLSKFLGVGGRSTQFQKNKKNDFLTKGEEGGSHKHIVKNINSLFCRIYYSIWSNQFQTNCGKCPLLFYEGFLYAYKVCKNNNDIRFDPQKVIGIIREYKF